MVCLGNICRSPIAEGILKEKSNLVDHLFFAQIVKFEKFSAGSISNIVVLSTVFNKWLRKKWLMKLSF